jgi:hypothetical protein
MHYLLGNSQEEDLVPGEYVVANRYGASSRKKTQDFDVLDCQDVEKVNAVNKPCSMSMVEMLTVQPTLDFIELVSQWSDKITVT